jgi:hypothetical protein
LAASATGVLSATSATFAVTAGVATRLVFTVQPTTTSAGRAVSPAVRVAAVDLLGNTDLTFTGTVTVAIGHNPSAGTLSGTVTIAGFGGVATFSTLNIDKAGSGYTLTAAATGLASATSTSFTITSGAATTLVFTVAPSSTTAGMVITPAVQVTARDPFGNTATTFSGNVTVAFGANPSGGVLSGTTTVAASGGVATFSDLSINATGSGYTLTAAAGGLSGATSPTFNIL